MKKIVNLCALFAACALLTSPASGLPLKPDHITGIVAKPSLVHKVHRCHANTQFDYVPQIDEEARHRHRGNCRPVIIESGGGRNDHCHADGRQHRHRGYGTTVHSHFGNSCRVDVWEERRNSGNGRGCVKVGPLTFCN